MHEVQHHISNIQIYMGLLIFCMTFFLIITEKIPTALSALAGGMLMVGVGILEEKKAFHAIDMEVIFLLIGMMIIVHIMSETGIFQWVAIKLAQFVKGDPFPLMLLLMLVTAVFSALLDNVTTILLIAPVSILLAQQLELDPIPFLLAEAMASNIGGTSTLIGDPPNILIGSAAGLTFNEFVINLFPAVFVSLIAMIITFWFIFGKKLKVSRDLKAKIMDLDASRALKDKKLLKKSLIVMGLVLIGFLAHNKIGVGPSVVAFSGAVVLMIISKQEPEEAFKMIEWKTLFFFIGLFMMVEGVVEIGAIKFMAEKALNFTGGNLKSTSMLILWLSAIVSAIVDNIPYTATLIPMIKEELIPKITHLNPAMGAEKIRYALWWSLSLGACLGGNGTLIGASANVVAAGIASKTGNKISFLQFTKYGVIITFESMIISSVYVWFKFLN